MLTTVDKPGNFGTIRQPVTTCNEAIMHVDLETNVLSYDEKLEPITTEEVAGHDEQIALEEEEEEEEEILQSRFSGEEHVENWFVLFMFNRLTDTKFSCRSLVVIKMCTFSIPVL